MGVVCGRSKGACRLQRLVAKVRILLGDKILVRVSRVVHYNKEERESERERERERERKREKKRERKREREGERERTKMEDIDQRSLRTTLHWLLRLTEFSNLFHNFAGARTGLYANCLGFRKWCQDSRKQPHPLITVPEAKQHKAVTMFAAISSC